MNISSKVREIEAMLKDRRYAVDDFCRDAEINRSTWSRWKADETIPSLATWTRALDAAEAIRQRVAA